MANVLPKEERGGPMTNLQLVCIFANCKSSSSAVCRQVSNLSDCGLWCGIRSETQMLQTPALFCHTDIAQGTRPNLHKWLCSLQSLYNSIVGWRARCRLVW